MRRGMSRQTCLAGCLRIALCALCRSKTKLSSVRVCRTALLGETGYKPNQLNL
jgi:hypothetical protein